MLVPAASLFRRVLLMKDNVSTGGRGKVGTLRWRCSPPVTYILVFVRPTVKRGPLRVALPTPTEKNVYLCLYVGSLI